MHAPAWGGLTQGVLLAAELPQAGVVTSGGGAIYFALKHGNWVSTPSIALRFTADDYVGCVAPQS